MVSDVNQQFQSILGRAPTADELKYVGGLMDTGDLSAQEIGEFLQSTPEYQRAQLTRDVESYGQKLQANDEQILRQGADIAGAQATSRFAGLGRPNSSALAASVFGQTGQMASNLAQSRQSALASFYGQGLQNNAALGVGQGQAAANRGYGLIDQKRQRAWQLEDYYRMKDDNESKRQSMSGWNAITPEFGINLAARTGAAIVTGGGSEAGRGIGAAAGLFGGGGGAGSGGNAARDYLYDTNKYGPVGGRR